MSDTTSDFTPNLALPFLLPAQAQKHVTVNESLAIVDSLLMGSVIRSDLSDPPSDPENGAAYIVPAEPSGAWADQARSVAVWLEGHWRFHIAKEGWRVWDQMSQTLLVFQAGVWQAFSTVGDGHQTFEQVGVGTSADAANPLSVRGPGALFAALETTHSGSGDFRMAINADEGAHTASIIYQSGYSGRAETGLTTDGDFALRVSDNGADWSDAIRVDPSTVHIGINQEPDNIDVLSVNGSAAFYSGDDYIRFNGNDGINMWSADSGPVYMRVQSPGSNLHFSVTTSDGTIKSRALIVRGASEEILIDFPFRPFVTNEIDLGAPWRVFKNLYVQNSPVVSSDARGKHDIETFDAGLELLRSLNPVSFTREPQSGARHIGLIAQQVRSALEEHDLENTAIWSLADPKDPDSAQAVSYGELIPVLIDAVNELAERIEDLEAYKR